MPNLEQVMHEYTYHESLKQVAAFQDYVFRFANLEENLNQHIELTKSASRKNSYGRYVFPVSRGFQTSLIVLTL